MFKREEISPERKRELFLKIRPIIAKQLEINENAITLASKITDDLGADSLDAIEIIMELEEAFNIEIPDEATDKMGTVEDIVLYLAG